MSGEMMLFPATVEEFMEQYKIVDSDHVYTNGTELVPIFRMRQWFEHLDSAIKTNADHIRSMTNDELAEWIAYRQGCFERQDKRCSKYGTCRDCWFDWLKEETKE